jgi:hypothetical protein
MSVRSRTVASVLALLAALSLALGPTAPAQALTTIGTAADWPGNVGDNAWGLARGATYGQVVTAPPGESTLTGFTFWMWAPELMTFRGEVYAWNPVTKRATGPNLYQSGPRSTTQNDDFEAVHFDTNVPVVPGQHYVLFASLSVDDWQPELQGYFGAMLDGSHYPGGSFFAQDNGRDESTWTERQWQTNGDDLAFDATFDGGPPHVQGLDPTIAGVPQVGQVLTADPGSVLPDDATLTYAWSADGTDIPGADGPTLAVTDDLVGARLSVTITATHDDWFPTTLTSEPTDYVRELHLHRTCHLADRHPRAGERTRVLCQGMTPGNTYTAAVFGRLRSAVADEYGEVTLAVPVPASAPTGRAVLVVVGQNPATIDTVVFRVRRAPAP